MEIWVWRDCEPLPLDPGNPRLMRAGMLCQELGERGHNVTWFSSTFDHYQKRLRDISLGRHEITSKLGIEIVQGLGYGTNGSPRRLLHNALVAKRFAAAASRLLQTNGKLPDLIVADLPMPDSALEAVNWGKVRSIPVVVSIRDLWPDFFLSFLSPAKALLAKPFIMKMDRDVKRACRGATHLVGISQGYLDWGLQKANREQHPSDAIIPLGYLPHSPADPEASLRKLTDLGIDFSKPIATFIGSWGKTYDLNLLTRSAELLLDRSNVQIIIAGSGEKSTTLHERAAKLGNVVLPGWLDRDCIATLLKNSSVALCPYHPDAPQGLPNKLFEYMSAGVYQISTLQTEARNVLASASAGCTVPPGDAEAFADAIISSLDNRLTDQQGSQIRAFFADHFDATKVYSDYVDILERYATKFV